MDFLKFITKLSNKKVLNHETINKLMEKEFPGYDDHKSMTKFRVLVPDQLKIIDESLLEHALKLLNIIYTKLYTNHATLDSIFTTDIRGPISKRFNKYSTQHKLSKSICKLTFEDKGNLINKNNDIRDEKAKNQHMFTAEDSMKIINKCIDSENPVHKIIALALVCGSRPIELIAKSTYTAIDEQWVTQDFIAKSKSKLSLRKPIIFMTSYEFIKKLESTRILLSNKYGKLVDDMERLNASIASAANEQVKLIIGPGHTFITCRKEYAQLSYELVGKFPNILGSVMSLQIWENEILGHKKGDHSASSNYNTYRLVDKIEKVAEEVSEQVVEKVAVEKVGKVEEKVVVEVVAEKTQRQWDYMNTVFDSHKKITQNDMEQQLKGIIPRAAIRLFMAEKRNNRLF